MYFIKYMAFYYIHFPFLCTVLTYYTLLEIEVLQLLKINGPYIQFEKWIMMFFLSLHCSNPPYNSEINGSAFVLHITLPMGYTVAETLHDGVAKHGVLQRH